MPNEMLKALSKRIESELNGNIIPFWRDRVIDFQRGGFIGRMTSDGVIDAEAPRGLILNARLLWSYSATYRFNFNPALLELAERAYETLDRHFWDHAYGGCVWLTDAAGAVLDDKKKCYGQAFYLYALAEYYAVTKNAAALDRAFEQVEWIERCFYDPAYGGYFEVCNRDGSLADNSRLSERDLDAKKSMNNHLHLLEAYSNLFRITGDAFIETQLRALIDLFTQRIIDQNSYHMVPFFDEAWTPASSAYTFGHDIEASWLLWEAAEVLHDRPLRNALRPFVMDLAERTLTEGVSPQGGLYNEAEDGRIIDATYDWWPQAEAVVGFLNAYQISGDQRYAWAAWDAWDFIDRHFIDREHGDWHWRAALNGEVDSRYDKVCEWKSPYHSARACIEALRRIQGLLQKGAANERSQIQKDA
ncbi:MAG: AGE family epimerase/isomerase [Candidatus Hinthialibacter antarcticus]|nr:AGE family epimerase/isomerase [Candidatus Hinthialibacter antarcticus]